MIAEKTRSFRTWGSQNIELDCRKIENDARRGAARERRPPGRAAAGRAPRRCRRAVRAAATKCDCDDVIAATM